MAVGEGSDEVVDADTAEVWLRLGLWLRSIRIGTSGEYGKALQHAAHLEHELPGVEALVEQCAAAGLSDADGAV